MSLRQYDITSGIDVPLLPNVTGFDIWVKDHAPGSGAVEN
jgi:hypothetical protein